MTVKALKKQLMAAIAMVVVSAIALSSSTYAWFVGQNSVEANGLTIKAQAEAGILISHHYKTVANNVWASTATGSYTEAQALLPTSTKDGSNWYHASAVALNDHTATAGSMVTLTGITETQSSETVAGAIGTKDGKNYYIVDQFDIYTTGTAATNLRLSNVVVSNKTDSSLDSSLRLLVVCGSNKYVVAPVAGATTSYTIGANPDGTVAAGIQTTAYTVAQMAATESDTHYLETSVSKDAGNPTEVQVYMYYEGEDELHYSDNMNDHNLSVTLTFDATVTA